MRATSRLTVKYQATIPAQVRDALGLRAGDRIEFSVKGTLASVRKVRGHSDDELAFRLMQAHAMSDWDTPEDDEAFRDL